MNRRMKVALVWLAIFFICVIVVALPFVFEDLIDIDQGGGAMIFGGAVIGLTAFITFFMYLAMARREKRMQGDMRSQLVVWEYSPEEWERFANGQYKKRIKESKQTWTVIAVISVITIIPIYFLIRDLVFAIVAVAALLAFLSIFIVLPSVIQRNRIRHSPHRAIIADNGVIVGKEIAMFDLKFTWLNALAVDDEFLTFTYSAIGSASIVQSFNFRVPVKAGGSADIDRVIEYYKGLEKQPAITDLRGTGKQADPEII
jgi:uncharacterized membrane protein